MFGGRCYGLPGCGHPLNWTCPCTCEEHVGGTLSDGSPLRPTNVDEASRLKAQIEGMARYVAHDAGCAANDLDYLDKTPCTCGLRAFYNPKGQSHDH